jgi:hypothetical protein
MIYNIIITGSGTRQEIAVSLLNLSQEFAGEDAKRILDKNDLSDDTLIVEIESPDESN